MPFFLLGKSPDGTLHLLTPSAFATRAEALSEASRVTAEPGFDRWDDEILAIDLDAGTPVLLVRPASAPVATETEPEPEVQEAEPEPEVQEPEPALEPEMQATEPEPVDASEPEVQEVESEPAEEAADEAANDAIAAVISDLSEESDGSFVAEVEADESPAGSVSLKDALQRTTEQLEAEGIVAPESVGPAIEDVAPEPVVEPTPVTDGAVPAWPWDTASDDKSFDLDALEAPRDDDDSLVRAPGDDETMSVSRPVIMGSYTDAPPSEGESAPAIEPIAVPDAIEELLPAPAPLPTEAPAEASEAPVSDFVDLPPAAVAPSIDSLSCEECVYSETCPNKGQLEPASCGSFQWK